MHVIKQKALFLHQNRNNDRNIKHIIQDAPLYLVGTLRSVWQEYAGVVKHVAQVATARPCHANTPESLLYGRSRIWTTNGQQV